MTTKIEDLKAGQWADIEAKVIQLWDNDHESISQVGIIGDDTSIVKFVSWNKSNLPLMEEGVEYRITNLPVSEYGDNLQVSLNKNTTIEQIGGMQTALPTDEDLRKAYNDAHPTTSDGKTTV